MQSAAKTVAAYLKELTPEKREVIAKLRKLVKQAAPWAKECMTYGMPTYDWEGVLLAFNAQKNYFALYGCDVDLLKPFRSELSKLNCGKSCLRFRKWDDVGDDLMTRILAAAVAKREREIAGKS